MEIWPKDRGAYYGGFAFASVVLGCYAGYFVTSSFYTSEWMCLLSFFLGAVHTALGILGDDFASGRGKWPAAVYFLIQCALLTAIVILSPIRGYMGIVVLPIASQSIFILGWRWATAVCVYLFALNVAMWGIPYGWDAALRAVINYSAGFAFTIAFTIITRQALEARAHAERLRHDLEEANAQLREHAKQVADLATVRERNRLAREIHDGVGHYLTVVKTQLDAAAALLPEQPDRARAAVGKAAQLAADALDDVRRSVGALRTDTERPPLPDVLRDLVSHAEPPVDLVVDGTPRLLSATAEHALFRSAQEGLTNIRKHAAASAARLALDFRDPARVRLTVTDNGRGAAGANGTCGLGAGGFGLRGLRERVEVIGGRVTAANRASGGFELSVEVPA